MAPVTGIIQPSRGGELEAEIKGKISRNLSRNLIMLVSRKVIHRHGDRIRCRRTTLRK